MVSNNLLGHQTFSRKVPFFARKALYYHIWMAAASLDGPRPTGNFARGVRRARSCLVLLGLQCTIDLLLDCTR